MPLVGSWLVHVFDCESTPLMLLFWIHRRRVGVESDTYCRGRSACRPVRCCAHVVQCAPAGHACHPARERDRSHRSRTDRMFHRLSDGVACVWELSSVSRLECKQAAEHSLRDAALVERNAPQQRTVGAADFVPAFAHATGCNERVRPDVPRQDARDNVWYGEGIRLRLNCCLWRALDRSHVCHNGGMQHV